MPHLEKELLIYCVRSMRYILSLFALLLSVDAFAVCPVCVAAVGAGFGISRYIGVADVIGGLWIGAVLMASSMWAHSFIVKRFKVSNNLLSYFILLILTAVHGLFLLPLYKNEVIIYGLKTIFGFDQFLFGAVIGFAIFFKQALLYNYLKKRNNNKPYFPYQKVIMQLLSLLILSIIFHLVLIYG